MKNELIKVRLRGLLPAPGGAGVFLEAEDKAMSIFIDPMVTRALQLALSGKATPRPLTHDLLGSVLEGLGVRLIQVVIHDCQEGTFFARLHLQQENELGKNYLEVDSRPSDAMVLAVKTGVPILVSRLVWEQVEDMKWAVDQLENDFPEP